MKKILLTMLLVMSYSFAKAQSTNLDREYIPVSYVKLPSDPVLEDKQRTYEINVINAMRSPSRAKVTKNKINISGFSKVNSNATIKVNIDISDIELGDVTITKTEKENKDKDGKVTSITRTYNAVVPYKTYATMEVSNNDKGTSYSKVYSDSKTFTSESFKSYSKAKDYYNNNRYNLRNRFRSAFFNDAVASMNGNLNTTYGYRPYSTEGEHLWILASKKHPETPKHKEAHQQLKEIFSKMRSNQPTEEIAQEAEAVIEYFNSIIPNYVGDKKRMRKVRYASYYNIAKIYYYLDQPDKTIEYAEKLIENDYDKSDGKYFKRIAESLKERLEKNQITSRHFEVVSEDLTGSEEISEEEIEDEPVEEEALLAYLITKSNDTITSKISASDLKSITFSAKLKVVDADGNESVTDYKAENCKALALANGDLYEVINFKESSLKDGAVDIGKLGAGAKPKFVKVLHRSDKIELFLFNDKEVVIKKPEDEKGKSTMSSGYLFGFKKKLTALAEGCPSLIEKVKNKEFKNTPESLTEFCEIYSTCSE
ncbi:hypothetical protein GWK08_15975 [Leptobacterium flavescens]|uniref:Tetratricopeptide repeat protein n=1 Tax=Leptobacterium flavescens TaxID=472055 RepID=A0A6P0UP59_9FLAO|nr:hypothetical protein [Leptobacterium flavescens]NER14955.1 hypothetical protein [Leptobacterium flavescens]